jgi:hypothetical protein
LPVPLAPPDTFNQDGTFSTFHAQPLAAVTVNEPGPPPLPNDAEEGATV